MLTEEAFNKLGLKCIYHKGVIDKQLKYYTNYYVYVISNNNVYYVGRTVNLYARLMAHRHINNLNMKKKHSMIDRI